MSGDMAAGVGGFPWPRCPGSQALALRDPQPLPLPPAACWSFHQEVLA